MNAPLTIPRIDSGDAPRRIAIVGTGVSGLVAASLLARKNDVVVYEAADYVGGHTNTVDVEDEDGTHPIDTGFIVHNERTYPVLCELFTELGIATRDTSMSFSVRCDRTGIEYGSQASQLFAQRRNLVRPSHLAMLADVVRWNARAERLAADLDESVTLGALLEREGFGAPFIERFILPMGGAIWSTEASLMLEFPASYFVRFLANHGMLTPLSQPTWRTVVGGSRVYVERLIAPFRDRIRLDTGVTRVTRRNDHVELLDTKGSVERFDEVVLAVHSDQALAMLSDPSDDEREVLSAIPYQRNEAVLHTDTTLLPRTRRAWASWNYRIPEQPGRSVSVSYFMNRLQGIRSRHDYVVSLNEPDIDPNKVIRRVTYHHPFYTPAGRLAQQRREAISGVRRTHYAGAYWGFGFHEDGARSGRDVARALGVTV